MVGTIQRAKETYEGFAQLCIGVAHTNARRLRNVTTMMIGENLYE
jgi:hypothetical protein